VGLRVAAAAARLAEHPGADAATVQPHVLDFAEALVSAGLAVRA
jgi:hypothetical protein